MRVRFLTHSPVLLPELGATDIREAFHAAHIFYYIKKDRGIENAVRKYLRSESIHLEKMVHHVQQLVERKYPFDMQIRMVENHLRPVDVEVVPLALEEDVDTERFRTRGWVGEALLDVSTSTSPARLRAIGLSYTESILDAEYHIFKELFELFYPELETLYIQLMGEIKTRWEIPLRMGMFNRNRFGGHFLFFWRIKEVREYIRRRLRFDIRPREILYLPRYQTIPGLVEWRMGGGSND